MSKDNVFVLLEAKEHMISEDTKKTKFVFLFSCMITVSLCLFHKAEMMALFGLIRLNPESKIPLITLIIPSLIISSYQFWLYRHYYEESINQWKSRKNNAKNDSQGNDKESKFKKSFDAFNEITGQFNQLANQANSTPPLSPIEQFEQQTNELNREINELLNKINMSSGQDTTWWIERHNGYREEELRPRMIQNLNEASRCFNDLSAGNRIEHKSIGDTILFLHDFKVFVNNSYYSKTLVDESRNLNKIFKNIQELVNSNQEKYYHLHDEFIKDQARRQNLLDNKWKECIESRDVAINHLKKLSVDEDSNRFLFGLLPFIVFFLTTMFSVSVIINNWDLLISSYKTLASFT
ncbi:hypothetical protein AB6C91_00560 [Vibrio cyclitrophicus]